MEKPTNVSGAMVHLKTMSHRKRMSTPLWGTDELTQNTDQTFALGVSHLYNNDLPYHYVFLDSW